MDTNVKFIPLSCCHLRNPIHAGDLSRGPCVHRTTTEPRAPAWPNSAPTAQGLPALAQRVWLRPFSSDSYGSLPSRISREIFRGDFFDDFFLADFLEDFFADFFGRFLGRLLFRNLLF